MRSLAAGLVALALAAPVFGQAQFGVWIDRPYPGESVFGEVQVVASVQSQQPVVKVEIFLDGESAGILVKPPWRLLVDLGYENRGHTIEVVARSATGEEAKASVETRPLKVDDSIDLSLRQLYVTVSSGERRVLDLGRDEFRVVDGGERQKIVTFEKGDVPLTAVLLLDCSLSMRGPRLEAALQGAKMFLDGMQELDEAKVVLFSDRLLRESEFTQDKETLAPVLERVEADGGTALNDHLFLGLQKLDVRQGRRVAVLFTDGADVHSVLAMDEVLRKARISPALIYWIYLRDERSEIGSAGYTTAWRDAKANEREVELLRRAIRETGGRVREVADPAELEDAFVEILAELREQYVLGYYPSEVRRDGSWREVRVRVGREGLQVRSRDGYLDY